MQKLYRINHFGGIDQSRHENALDTVMSPDARNMCTDDGALAVARGYTRHIDAQVAQFPVTPPCAMLIPFCLNGSSGFLAVVYNRIYINKNVNSTWTAIYTYPDAVSVRRVNAATASISGADYLILGCGEAGARLVKFNGTSASDFGSAEKLSDFSALYMGFYRSRLFVAGDPANKNRLYWSCLPGSVGGVTRTIEDFGPVAASPNVEGGHTEIGSGEEGEICAVVALPSQLLIFKRRALYRLIGDKPANFVIERVDAADTDAAFTSVTAAAGAAYFLTRQGVYFYNGVSVRPLVNSRSLKTLLASANISASRGAIAEEKLYFTMSLGEGTRAHDAMAVYDLARGTYMVRNGFSLYDAAAFGRRLYVLDKNLRVCRFGEGDTYDGDPVNAYWSTPHSDLMEKTTVKGLRALYISGMSDNGADVRVDVNVTGTGGERRVSTYSLTLPAQRGMADIPLAVEGRAFSLKFYNGGGGRFTIDPGVEVRLEEESVVR